VPPLPADAELLPRLLISPAAMAGLTEAEWDQVLPLARTSHLSGRLASEAQAHGLGDRLPARVRGHFDAAAAVAAHNERTIRWELNRIQRALRHLDIPILLLKGAAYVAAELPAARGRSVSDLDIMVPRAALDPVETGLEHTGWQPMKLDSYDQRYYRRWMHELPPLRHGERGTIVDVHHTILPPTARLKPDPARLWAEARRLDGSRLHVLAPADMVLHSAAHLFHDGDLHRSLRDLVDFRDLLGVFGTQPGFWSDLVARARTLDLGRPLFYALRYARRLLATAVPDEVMTVALAHAPPRPVLSLMDRLVPRALVPRPSEKVEDALGSWLLYTRSHWLRMPPRLLLPHLGYQAVRRGFGGG
jgi:Uncharacterised nucleotidyltransferase